MKILRVNTFNKSWSFKYFFNRWDYCVCVVFLWLINFCSLKLLSFDGLAIYRRTEAPPSDHQRGLK